MYQEKIEWHANRLLSKLNYVVHTDAIKKYIVPTLTQQQIKFIYATEADVLNVALFGKLQKNGEIIIQNLPKKEILEIFNELAHDNGKCIIIVTHSSNVCDCVDEVFDLKKVKNN